MTEETTTQRLASLILGRPVGEWIIECRKDGDTWRQVASRLAIVTGDTVNVSHETIRQWAEQETAA